MGKNLLFNDWITQEMAPHSWGRKNYFINLSYLALILHILESYSQNFNQTYKCLACLSCLSRTYVISFSPQPGNGKPVICDVTENTWCHLTVTVGRYFPPLLPHELFGKCRHSQKLPLRERFRYYPCPVSSCQNDMFYLVLPLFLPMSTCHVGIQKQRVFSRVCSLLLLNFSFILFPLMWNLLNHEGSYIGLQWSVNKAREALASPERGYQMFL